MIDAVLLHSPCSPNICPSRSTRSLFQVAATTGSVGITAIEYESASPEPDTYAAS